MFADRLAFTRIPDFAALLETQRRLLESLARSTRIVADAARGCSEHQAALARLALNELTSCMLPAGAALAPASLREHTAGLGAFLERAGRETAALQRIMSESLLALLDETRRAWLRPNGAAGQPGVPSAPETMAAVPTSKPQAAALEATTTEPAPARVEEVTVVEEAADKSETPAATRPRRGRKSEAEA